jgi:hypothetical protein
MPETTVVNPLREGLRLQRTPEPCDGYFGVRRLDAPKIGTRTL